MRHSPFALYPRTALISALLDSGLRKPVERQSLAEIQADRGTVPPDRPPFSWVTGRVDRSVGITYGTARARDGYELLYLDLTRVRGVEADKFRGRESLVAHFDEQTGLREQHQQHSERAVAC